MFGKKSSTPTRDGQFIVRLFAPGRKLESEVWHNQQALLVEPEDVDQELNEILEELVFPSLTTGAEPTALVQSISIRNQFFDEPGWEVSVICRISGRVYESLRVRSGFNAFDLFLSRDPNGETTKLARTEVHRFHSWAYWEDDDECSDIDGDGLLVTF